MSIAPFPFGQTITVVRPAGRDHHGDPLPGDEHEVSGVAIYPASVDEALNGTKLDADEVLLGAHGADIRSDDTIYLAGDEDRKEPRYVKGPRWDVDHPATGWQPGARVLLSYTKGGL